MRSQMTCVFIRADPVTPGLSHSQHTVHLEFSALREAGISAESDLMGQSPSATVAGVSSCLERRRKELKDGQLRVKVNSLKPGCLSKSGL